MSKDGNKIKVSASPCLTEQEMGDYIRHRLSPAERNRVEKHLLECDLCADAMEGLSMMKSERVPADIDAWIDKTVGISLVNKKGKIVPFRFNYRVAAVLALLLVAGGVLYFTVFKSSDHEKIITQYVKPIASSDTSTVKPQPEEKEKLPEQSEVQVKPGKERKVLAEAVRKAKENANAKNIASDSILESGNANSLVSAQAEELKMADQEEVVYNEGAIQRADSFISGIATTDNYVADENTSQGYINLANSREKSVTQKSANKNTSMSNRSLAPPAATPAPAAPNEVVADNSRADAMHSYEQKDYSEAAKRFDNYIKTHAYDEQATFYAAVSNLKINNAAVALSQLNRVLNNDQSSFTDAAHWYKALTLVKLNRMEEAKRLLEEIKNSNSRYAGDAGKMLEKL